jgi:hypothetical protein
VGGRNRAAQVGGDGLPNVKAGGRWKVEGEKMEGMKIRISTLEIKKIQYPKS